VRCSVSIGWLLLPLACLVGQEQGRPVGPPLPLILHHAESFSGRPSDSGLVRELRGNVWLQQGNAVLRCGSAVQYMNTGLVLLRDNVRLEQGELRIRAPFILYDPMAGTATAQGGVEVQQGRRRIRAQKGIYTIPRQELLFYGSVHYRDDTLELYTDTLRYFRSTEVAHAWGGVYLESPVRRLAAEADSLDYSPQQGRLHLSGSVLVQRQNNDSASSDTLWLSAPTVLLVQTAEGYSLRAFDTVMLVRDTLWAAQAASLEWQNSPEEILLSGSPFVWYASAEMTAESIRARLSSGQLHQLLCRGQARLRLHSGLPHRTHQLRADSIVVTHTNDSLSELHAIGNARSLYCHRSAEGAPEGLFRHSADRIELLFSGDSLSQARWLGSVYGEYVPEVLVAEKFSSWALPGMEWTARRPAVPSWRYRPRWVP